MTQFDYEEEFESRPARRKKKDKKQQPQISLNSNMESNEMETENVITEEFSTITLEEAMAEIQKTDSENPEIKNYDTEESAAEATQVEAEICDDDPILEEIQKEMDKSVNAINDLNNNLKLQIQRINDDTKKALSNLRQKCIEKVEESSSFSCLQLALGIGVVGALGYGLWSYFNSDD